MDAILNFLGSVIGYIIGIILFLGFVLFIINNLVQGISGDYDRSIFDRLDSWMYFQKKKQELKKYGPRTYYEVWMHEAEQKQKQEQEQKQKNNN